VGILALMNKFQQQIVDLRDQYKLMQGSLSLLSQIYQDDQEFIVMLEVFANCAKMFAGQTVLLNTMLSRL
jgi:hypothetical protein